MFKAPGSNHISNLVLSPVSCLPLVSILNTQYSILLPLSFVLYPLSFILYPCLGPVVIPITPRYAVLRNLITTGQNAPSALRSLPTSRFKVHFLIPVSWFLSQYSILFPFKSTQTSSPARALPGPLIRVAAKGRLFYE